MKSKKNLIWVLTLAPAMSLAYTGYRSTEAIMRFDAYVDTAYESAPSKSQSKVAVQYQLDHLFGPMALSATMAAPKGDEVFDITDLQKQQDGTYRIYYSYEGTIVIENGPVSRFDIVLPRNPQELFSKTDSAPGTNPCTDGHYQSEGDFWYFWSPDRPGCSKLIKPGVDYLEIEASIERVSNSEKSRPEYERLPDKKGVISIYMLFGLDEAGKNPDPVTSEGRSNEDINASNYRGIREALVQMGFASSKWTDAQLKSVLPSHAQPRPFVETLTLDYKSSRAKRIEVTLFFGQTGIDEDSTAFHYFLKKALKDGSVIIYDGHSGLGGNIHLRNIEKLQGFRFQPAKDRYQILFFNSCSSYAYYNTMFFGRKRTSTDPQGTKNLDIITTGLETAFDSMGETNMTFLKAIHNWVKQGTMLGYKQLIKRLETDNLAGVNGDEDNPTTN